MSILIDAVNDKVVADSDTTLGYELGLALRSKIAGMYEAGTTNTLDLGEWDKPQPVSTLTCRLLALLDFAEALVGCQSISDPVARDACMANAQNLYHQAIASCDAA